MIWTCKRLEHDWFISKDIWRIFDWFKGLVDFLHLQLYIYSLSGATVNYYDE